jgi:hypothetical protein
LDGYTQEGCRNGCGILVWTLILPVEESFQLILQISIPTTLFGGLERIP